MTRLVNSKHKGNANELRIYRLLRDSGVECKCIRGSGNLRDESGDILAKDSRGVKWLVECKHFNNATAKPSIVEQWWQGIVKAAILMDCRPALQMRENRRPDRYRLNFPPCRPRRWAVDLKGTFWVEVSGDTFMRILKGELAW